MKHHFSVQGVWWTHFWGRQQRNPYWGISYQIEAIELKNWITGRCCECIKTPPASGGGHIPDSSCTPTPGNHCLVVYWTKSKTMCWTKKDYVNNKVKSNDLKPNQFTYRLLIRHSKTPLMIVWWQIIYKTRLKGEVNLTQLQKKQ